MNKTITVAHVADEDRVPYVTYLLRGVSADWWDNCQESRGPSSSFTWDEFQAASRRHHIPDSLMERKREEFYSLTQGSKNVLAYRETFTKLARYAGDEVSMDAKKQDKFRRGLSPEIKYAINLIKCKTFEELVDTSLRAEYGRQEFAQSRKHSREVASSSAAEMPPQKRRIWVPYATSTEPTYMPRPTGFAPRPPTPVMVPRGSQGQRRTSNQVQQRQNVDAQQMQNFEVVAMPMVPSPSSKACFKCGEPGHISIHCPQNKHPPKPPRSSSTQAMVRAPTIPKAFNYNNKPRLQHARANLINTKEAKEAPEVVLGTLLVNSVFARVLFDTGASHSFVSTIFAQKHELPLDSLANDLMVYSPGAQMKTSKISHGNQILIGGYMFLASLIVLGSSDIDVILGMDWLKANKAQD
jgi:hypothetical protein